MGITKNDFLRFIEEKPSEREIVAFIAQDPTLIAEAFANPKEEYIVFKEYVLDHEHKVDYAVFTDRSRMKVKLIELKGADFNFINADKTFNEKISKAVQQVRSRFGFISKYPEKFRNDAIKHWQDVESGIQVFQSIRGEKLECSPDKVVLYSGAVIGGLETNEIVESNLKYEMEAGMSPFIKYDSWHSFIRGLRRT